MKALTWRRASGWRRATDSVLPLRCEFCERELGVEFVGHARTRRYYRFEEASTATSGSGSRKARWSIFESVKQAEEHGYEPYRRGPQREIMNATKSRAPARRWPRR